MGTTSTKIQDHSQRAHALLSASGANRWMNCTPSAVLEDKFGEKKTSAYAEEGTLAHEFGELYLRKDGVCDISEDEFNSRLEELMSNDAFDEEMLDVVPIYSDYCIQQLNEARTQNEFAIMEVEQRFDLTEFIPESFGTGDCSIINDEILEIIDLKYGKGVPVYATYNTQLMLYALGALRKYDTMYDIKTIVLTIVQPRINNISSFEISVTELYEWANTELKPKAELAHRGEGELCVGDWCKFCSVKNKCRKLYEKQIEIAKYEFADAELLSDDEIADILRRTPALVEWANSICAYAQSKAINENKYWPGFKIVEGRSTRKWVNEEDAVDAILSRLPELSEEDIYNMKLKPITALEKAIGKKKFAEVLADVVIKPSGAPTLVPEDDKRPAIGTSQAKIDFSD